MEEPFPYLDNLDELLEVVCSLKERPPIPNDCPTALRQLIQACWHHDPTCRPNFLQITAKVRTLHSLHHEDALRQNFSLQLDEIFIRMAIRDEEGQRFWIENFPKQVP